ncbi:MAG: glycosyltransferase family 2 protein [Thermoflexales bacterium]|nr:glycosyltransferase family 2 protein [Thermoflexales bacterium]
MPPVSVILPTYNRLDRLQRVLKALENQAFPRDRFDVIVVSDGSTDGTREYLQALQSPLTITFVEQANQGVAVARNTGLSRATGDLVVFIDDDVVPSPQLVAEHVACHGDSNLVVLGPMLTPNDFDMKPWVRWEQSMLMKQYDDMLKGRWAPTARQFYTGNTSLARRHVIEAGGFDPHFRRAEDVELAYRLAQRGLRFVFNDRAIGWHYAERSFKAWLEIPYVYGRNDVIFTRDKGQTWLLPTICYEFHGRHPLIKTLTRLCLDRAARSKWAIAALKQVARVDRVSRMAYSGIFNLRHYQGVADELGGREKFLAAVRASTVPVGPPSA